MIALRLLDLTGKPGYPSQDQMMTWIDFPLNFPLITGKRGGTVTAHTVELYLWAAFFSACLLLDIFLLGKFIALHVESNTFLS